MVIQHQSCLKVNKWWWSCTCIADLAKILALHEKQQRKVETYTASDLIDELIIEKYQAVFPRVQNFNQNQNDSKTDERNI